jgi:ubiquitin C-terminal hydrolase
MKNLGNSRYMSAVLHCLMNTPRLTQLFLENTYTGFCGDEPSPLLTAYSDLCKQVWFGSKWVVNPLRVKREVCAVSQAFSNNDP